MEITDAVALQSRLRRLLSRIDGQLYCDTEVRLNLEHLRAPDLDSYADAKTLDREIRLLEEDQGAAGRET